jgi:hypothetical protein
MVAVDEADLLPDAAGIQPLAKIHGGHEIEIQVLAQCLRPGLEYLEDTFSFEWSHRVENARAVLVQGMADHFRRAAVVGTDFHDVLGLALRTSV